MGTGLAIGACAREACRYESAMKIPHTSTRFAGIAVLLICSVSSHGFAQPAQNAAELAQQGADHAWAITRDLTTDIGPRMAGTEAEAIARRWAARRLQAMGFANVREEPFDMPVWVRGAEEAWLTSTLLPQKLAITALGNSESTGPKGIEGEIAYFESFIPAHKIRSLHVIQGKWIMRLLWTWVNDEFCSSAFFFCPEQSKDFRFNGGDLAQQIFIHNAFGGGVPHSSAFFPEAHSLLFNVSQKRLRSHMTPSSMSS